MDQVSHSERTTSSGSKCDLIEETPLSVSMVRRRRKSPDNQKYGSNIFVYVKIYALFI